MQIVPGLSFSGWLIPPSLEISEKQPRTQLRAQSCRARLGESPACPGPPCPQPPSADGQQPPRGGHSLACDAAADQASDPRPQTQPDVDLSCLTLKSPLGCQNHPLVPAAGRDVSAASSWKSFLLLFFFQWCGQHQDAKARSQEGCLSTYRSTYLWICSPSGFQPSLCTWLLRGTGWRPLLPQHPMPCSGKPRMLQCDYLIWILARPSA